MDWSQIWNTIGARQTENLRDLDGWDDTAMDGSVVIQAIRERIAMSPGETVLEVGCGAGYIAQFVPDTNPYVGIDLSPTLVKKHNTLLGRGAIVGDAASLPFADNSFDVVICCAVVQYMPDIGEVAKAISEMKRVARRAVYVACARYTTRAAPAKKHRLNGAFEHLVKGVKPCFADAGFVIADSVIEPEHYFDAHWEADK